MPRTPGQAPDDTPTERWVSVDEVAAHVGVRKDSIYRWIENRGLPATKIGKLWKLKLTEVDAWMRAGGANGASEPQPSNPLRADDRSRAGTRTSCVLIVDDDPSLRATLRDLATDQGYGALTAADGLEALGILRSVETPRPSVIILDIRMPNMDGLQFLEEQKRDPELAGIPVIVIAADRSEVAGAPVIRKPLDISKLVDAIRGAIRS
jgi:excisionase family DNA binding protein